MLKTALDDMETQVQSFKRSLPFTAPELIDSRYAELQTGLAEIFASLYTKMSAGDGVEIVCGCRGFQIITEPCERHQNG